MNEEHLLLRLVVELEFVLEILFDYQFLEVVGNLFLGLGLGLYRNQRGCFRSLSIRSFSIIGVRLL